MSLMLDRPGTVYYVVAPLGYVGTRDNKDQAYDMSPQGQKNWESLPENGQNDNINDEKDPDPPVLVSPDYLNIVNASSNYRNDKIKYGSVTCGSSVEVELVDGLDKQTQYIAYFVLQGTSQTYSRVLAYRFKTTDVAKPKLTLTNNSPSVDFKTVDTANLNYALVATNELPTSLKGPFKGYVDTSKASDWDKFADDKAETYTVIDALCNRYQNTGYSVFDQFAGTDIRRIVEDFVSGSNPMGASPAYGSKSLTQANNYFQTQNFTNDMTGGTQYYCLATAVSPLGSETSFGAVAGVHLKDLTPPEFKYVNTSCSLSDDGKTYSGRVTFDFDEPVYQLVGSTSGIIQTPKEVWQTQYTISTGDQAKAVNLADIIGSSYKSNFSCVGNTREPSSSLTLDFKNIPIGTTLTLFSNSFICDANSNSTWERLTFVLVEDGNIGLMKGVGFALQK